MDSDVKDKLVIALAIVWRIGGFVTFGFLTFFDGYIYTWWNWPIALAVNMFMGAMWPIYWVVLRPIFG